MKRGQNKWVLKYLTERRMDTLEYGEYEVAGMQLTQHQSIALILSMLYRYPTVVVFLFSFWDQEIENDALGFDLVVTRAKIH